MIRFATFLICFCVVFAAPSLRGGEIRDGKSALTEFCKHFGSAPDAEQIHSCNSFFEVSDGRDVWYVQPKREYLRRNSAGFFLGYQIYSVAKGDGAIKYFASVN